MENTSRTAQILTSYSNLENVILSGVSTITGVPIVEFTSPLKKKEVALAKAIACKVFNDYGYGIREIGRLTNIDGRGVNLYIESHDNRMADRKYSIKYNKVKAFVDGYESSNEVTVNKLNEVIAKLMLLEERYDHLKELLINN